MAEYEITYLTNPQLPEEERGRLDGAVDSQLAELGGSIAFHSPHVRRRLAYPLSKNSSAFLRMIQVELPAEAVDSLRQFLKKQSDILRATILQTARRQEVALEVLEPTLAKSAWPAGRATAGKPAKAEAKSMKPVTMEEVEKGIEEALTEEVK